MKRRKFNKMVSSLSSGIILSNGYSCSNLNKVDKYGISLAQWSLHKMIKIDKTLNPIDFAQKSKELGFDAIEYVSTLYRPILEKLSIKEMTKKLINKSKEYDIKNLLIMVDDEGNLSSSNLSEIKEAIDKHKRWIEMASKLECHSVRVNLEGEDQLDKWKDNSIKGLSLLSEFASNYNVNIIVENHGGNSSIGKELAEVIKNVNLDNCGTLPDFGNFCIKRKNGSLYDGPCDIEYDKYEGMRDLMPYAKAVSAKSYDFDPFGNETTIDFKKMMDIVDEFNYNGYLGIEYEGNNHSEINGIELTKKLIQKYNS
ncbi:MAG: sugar phosphate isomerase/epimerase [Flavobacteriaceae bacterium]|nr:sugar phosphate isomerase/epimerase [Flavobacteriaceae bacterium]